MAASYATRLGNDVSRLFMITSIFLLTLLASIVSFVSKNRHGDTYNVSKVLLYTALVITACNLFIAHFSKATDLQILYFAGIHFKLMFKFDYLASIMLTVVLSISLIIYQYAERYLESDTTRPRFLAQLCLITLSVSILVLSDNLLTAFIGWQFIGITLYITLNHYHFDANANRASKKKFVINRWGDICFLAAVILSYQYIGQSSYAALYQHPHTGLIGLLVFIAIMTKSAQFPFHIWLPDTMEAPTPVSALMHAGVINSGGFLLARLAPLYAHHLGLMYFVSLIGLLTTLIGGLFMLYQYDTKKKLAYSTMGQMGYMILQCGLGAFASAVFHLITHGFYKASLFLNAGNTLVIQYNDMPKRNKGAILVSLMLSALLIALGTSYARIINLNLPILIWFFITSSILQLLQSNLNRNTSIAIQSLNTVLVTALLIIYITLLASFSQFLKHLDVAVQLSTTMQYCIGITLLLIQVIMLWGRYPKFMQARRLKCLLINKFYIEAFLRYGFLNPLRRIGDIINRLFQISKPWSYGLCLTVLILLMIILSLATHNIELITHITIISLLGMMLITITAANRSAQLAGIVGWLGLFELGMINLAFVSDGSAVTKIGFYHLLNMGTLFVIINLLIHYPSSHTNHNHQYTFHNKLGWRKAYVATLLILMLGVPGTASFVTEYYIFANLITHHILYAILFGLCMIILSISILHCLQLYIFDQNPLYKKSLRLSWPMHTLSWLVIGLNLVSGIHPIWTINLM